MRKLLALTLLTLALAGTAAKHFALDGGDPPPQCAPKTCPQLPQPPQ